MITIKKIGVFVFISILFLLATNNVNALEKSSLLGEGRYFVASESSLVERLFGARHQFEGGFTTDLTRGEIWTLGKIFRIEVREVPHYTINKSNVSSSLEGLFNISESNKKVEEKEEVLLERENYPEESIGWGMKVMYGDNDLKTTSGGEDVRIAVLDTGIASEHLDIRSEISDCVDFTRSSTVKNTCEDKNGHGTHVTGIIASDGGFDGEGIWGLAPDAEILAYKVCSGEGICWADDIAVAINYASYNDADIILMSFGGDEESFLVKKSINHASENNILLVASAGNDDSKEASLDFPAANSKVIAVAAIDNEFLVPEWSSRGDNNGDFIIEDREVEFVAPGVNIESTWLDNGYRYLSGTSVAAPFIAGLAAKLWDGDAVSTRSLLQSLAIDVWDGGDDTASGLGLPIFFQ